MFEESDWTVECLDQGFCWWFARQRAIETGKALVVLRAPEDWELDDAERETW